MTPFVQSILGSCTLLTEDSETVTKDLDPTEVVAESLSLQLQADEYLSVAHPGEAFQNILAYGALLSSNPPDWFTDTEVRYFAQKCYEHQYQGDWAKLQILLEECTSFQEYEAAVLQMYSSRDFYGNIVRGIKRYQKTLVGRKRDAKSRVRRKVRRRGYNDKGSCAAPWWNPGTPRDVRGNLIQQIPKIDRRDRVKNLLIRSEDNFPEGTVAPNRCAEQLALLVDEATDRKELVNYVNQTRRKSRNVELEDSAPVSEQEFLNGDFHTIGQTSDDDQSSEIEKFQTLWNACAFAIAHSEKTETRDRNQGSDQSPAKSTEASA